LNVDDDFSLTKLFGQALVFPLQLAIFQRGRGDLRLRSALVRRQTVQDTCFPFLPPFRQMRRIEPVPPKQRADLARCSGRIRLRQYLLLERRRELAPFRSRHYLRVRAGRCTLALGITQYRIQ